MDDVQVERILHNPKFQQLVAQQRRLSWSLTGLMLFIYIGFIVLVAYKPEFLHHSFNGGIITWGIPLGLGVIATSFMLCGIYAYICNNSFDQLNREAMAEVAAITQQNQAQQHSQNASQQGGTAP